MNTVRPCQKQPGFVSATLLKEDEKEAIEQRVIRFQSLEAAVAWRGSLDHETLYKENADQLYDVIAQK